MFSHDPLTEETRELLDKVMSGAARGEAEKAGPHSVGTGSAGSQPQLHPSGLSFTLLGETAGFLPTGDVGVTLWWCVERDAQSGNVSVSLESQGLIQKG